MVWFSYIQKKTKLTGTSTAAVKKSGGEASVWGGYKCKRKPTKKERRECEESFQHMVEVYVIMTSINAHRESRYSDFTSKWDEDVLASWLDGDWR